MRPMKGFRWIGLLGLLCVMGFLLALHWNPLESEKNRALSLNPNEYQRLDDTSVGLSASTSQTVSKEKIISLISRGEKSDIEWTSRTPAAKRVRRIFPDPIFLTENPVLKKGDILEIAPFDDAIFSAKINGRSRNQSSLKTLPTSTK